MQRISRLMAMTALATFFALAVSACGDAGNSSSSSDSYGEVRLDASSDQAMQDSLEAMAEGMDEAEQKALGQALGVILLVRGMQLQGDGGSQAEMEQKLKDEIDGLTASELLAKAERLQAEMQQ